MWRRSWSTLFLDSSVEISPGISFLVPKTPLILYLSCYREAYFKPNSIELGISILEPADVAQQISGRERAQRSVGFGPLRLSSGRTAGQFSLDADHRSPELTVVWLASPTFPRPLPSRL